MPLKVVVVGDAHAAALKVASDLEQGGYEPSVFLAPGEADLERIAPGCDLVLAWADAKGVPPDRVLELAAEHGFPPVVAYAEAYTEDDIVRLVRAGARDCVRRGDHGRLNAAVERERARAESLKAEGRKDAEAGDRYRALIEEIPALTYVAWADDSGSRAYVSPQLLAMTGFSPGEWLAEPDMWVRRLHPEDRERVLRQFRDACASGGGSRASTGSSIARGVSCGGATRGGCCRIPTGRPASCGASSSTSPSRGWPRSRCARCASSTS